jgi:branched-chain amino acid transport system substrate-binding protein
LGRKLTPLVLALALAGCGGGDGDDHFRVSGSTLTVYTSVPRSGDSVAVAAAVAAGQRLALEDAGGRVGRWRVRLVELSSTEGDDRSWDPDVVRANAERAAEDATTIAYLGELEYGGSAISVPVTNDKGILQVSPYDGLTTLTQAGPGGPQSGPERYYPTEQRTFVRIVPPDRLQARALVEWAQELGASRIAIAHDDRLFGRELASEVSAAATRARVEVTGVEEVRPSSEGYADVAERLGERTPQALIYTGMAGDAVSPFLATMRRAVPAMPVFASGGVANTPVAAADFRLVKPAFPPRGYSRSGRRVLRRLQAGRGGAVAPEALYGYESMQLVLDALRAAGQDADDRRAVIREALAPRSRRSVVGTYAVRSGGDVSTARVAGYRRLGSRLVYQGPREPGSATAPAP